MVELLVRHGADPLRRRADGCTPHTLAELAGNHDIATWLLAHGAKDELSPLERFVAACARGDRAERDAMLDAHPALRTELRPEHHLMLHRPAESGNAAVLETMLACGFDPHAKDKDNVTALHRAAMGGHPEAVRVLLAVRRGRQRARRHVLGDAARLGGRRARACRGPAPIMSASRAC